MSITVNATALSVVQKGAAFLDSRPTSVLARDWREKVNVGTLAVWSTSMCPLGQIFGDYYVGKVKLDLTSTQCEGYGFCEGGGSDGTYTTNETLTAAWKHILSAPKVGDIYVDSYGDGFKIEAVIKRASDSSESAMVSGGSVKRGLFVTDNSDMYGIGTSAIKGSYKLHQDPKHANGDVLVGTSRDTGKKVVIVVNDLGGYREVLFLNTDGYATHGTLDYAERNYGPLLPITHCNNAVNLRKTIGSI